MEASTMKYHKKVMCKIRTWMRRGVMFMGIDVNHPGNVGIKSDTNKKTADLEPSVIGVVANCGK
ncbi:hypothetical protein D917_07674, partial [Trichinella nativa]